jgi:hypothetical protein
MVRKSDYSIVCAGTDAQTFEAAWNTGDNGSALEEEPLLQDIKSLEALGLTHRQAQY